MRIATKRKMRHFVSKDMDGVGCLSLCFIVGVLEVKVVIEKFDLVTWKYGSEVLKMKEWC